MKTPLPILILAFAIGFSGCATNIVKVIDQVAIVRDAFNGLLPDDFSGPLDLSRNDQYMDITLRAGNLHKNSAGQWTWDWVEYQRKTHIPWFAGANWQSDVHFKIGSPKP